MTKRKSKNKNNRKGKKGQALFGTETRKKHPVLTTLAEGGLVLAAAIAAGGAGAALGKHALLAGVPVTLYGIHRQNKYIIAAGLGLSLGSGKTKSATVQGVEGVEGFDIKQIAEQAKDRAGSFFRNFSEKLYLAPATGGTAGLDGEEQVSYFVNPYSEARELDMSAIDRIQEQIAEMNKGTAGLNDAATEREF